MANTIRVQQTYACNLRPLKQAIKESKLTYRQLAKEYGCWEGTISRVMTGALSSLPILQWLCHRVDLPIERIITGPSFSS